MDKNRGVYFIVMGLFFFVGCGVQQQVAPSEPLCLQANKAELMAVAENVLKNMNFVIEKYDIEQGFIKTRPLRAGQFPELWRRDNAGSFNSAEANLHSIQRIVELNARQKNGQICLRCKVQTRRLSMTKPEVVNIDDLSRTFTSTSGALMELEPQSESMEWIDLGADHFLERKILEQIEKNVKN